MPGYSYVAIDKKGKEKRGSIDAESRERAIDTIKNNGLLLVNIKEQGALNRDLNMNIGGNKVKPRDLCVFCRQFVSIMEAGVPMKEALQMLEQQTEKANLKKAIAGTLASVEKGNTLADSMRGEGGIFPEMLIDMVEAGESSGNLELSFSRMAVHFEKEAKLRATVKKATIYPIILIIVAVAVIFVMLLYVIPIFMDMFADLDVEMPGVTMAVMNASKWTGTHWYIVAAVIIGIVLAYRAYYSTTNGRLTIDRIKMKIPIFGKLTVKSACAEFARTTSTLLAAGIPMTDCLDTCGKIIKNIHYTNALKKAKEEVMKGIPLSEPLERSGIFPPMVYHMTGIGEETGNIEVMLDKLADYYDEEVELATQAVLAALEPMIIVFMAFVIGLVVISVILPIRNLYAGLDNL